MSKAETRQLFIMMQQQFYEDKRYHFLALGNEGQYTESQKRHIFELIAAILLMIQNCDRLNLVICGH